jgi:hypothetical protein
VFLARAVAVENNTVMIGSLSSKDVKLITNTDSRTAYDRSGYLLFVRERSLIALPFDAGKLKVTGDPFPIAEQVRYNQASGAASFTVSDNGVLAYRGDTDIGNRRLTWFDRSGKAQGTVGVASNYFNPELSPDGKRVAVQRADASADNQNIWIVDMARGTPTRLTFGAGADRFPVWSHDGNQIFFSARRNQTDGVYMKPSNGAGNEQLILKSPAVVWDTSADGKSIIYGSLGASRELSVLPLSGDRKPLVYLPQSNFTKLEAQLSPDGRWLAYASNESGTSEVYVQSFPTPSAKFQISTNGGRSPRWRGDGKEIFYLAAGQKLNAVPVRAAVTALETSTPISLFEVRIPALTLGRQQYDVTADGQRFLVNSLVDESTEAPITVVTNWTAGLKK